MIAKPVDIPRVSFYTVGCRLNQAETSLLQNGFRQKGFVPVAYGQETDLLVVNSCTVTEGAESDCRRVVRQVLRHSPQAFVAVTGCFAQTGFHALRRVEGCPSVGSVRAGSLFPCGLAFRVRCGGELSFTPPPTRGTVRLGGSRCLARYD